MDSKYIVGVITIAVTAMLVGSVLIPVIDTSSRGGTEYEDNPDWAGWIRFDLNRSAAAAYEISITQDENGIYVGAGTDVQAYDDSSTGEYATIFYADSNTVVWADDGDAYKIMGTSNGSPVYFTTSDDLTISRDSNGVSVSDGVNSYAFDTPTWAYVPKSTGTYGFYPYDAERGVSVSDAPTAVVGGGFAGVYAYNDITRYAGLGLTSVPIVEDGMYYGATWEKVADTPDDVQIAPLDPSIIIPGGDSTQPIINPIDPDPEPDAEIMAVPTPTYTDGDWGYDIIQVDGVDKAVIVSYSGSGGNIVVPASVGGYDVHRFGKTSPTASSGSNNVIDNSSISADSTITFTSGIIEIGRYALSDATNLTGSLVIPDSITSIGRRAFNGCSGFTGSLVIPDSVTSIGESAFFNCSGFTGSLVIPDSVTLIDGYTFYSCSGFTGSLVIPDSVTSIGRSAFYGCSGFTGSLVIPDSVTSIRDAFLNCNGFTSIVIAGDAVPDASNAFSMSGIAEILDLSNTVDYSIDRYGLPSTATVSDSIGDSFGFIASCSVAHTTDNPITPYKSLLYAIPVIILIVGLLIMAGFVIAKRDY